MVDKKATGRVKAVNLSKSGVYGRAGGKRGTGRRSWDNGGTLVLDEVEMRLAQRVHQVHQLLMLRVFFGVLEGAVLTAVFHGLQRTHVPVGLVLAAFVNNQLGGGFLGAAHQRAHHHGGSVLWAIAHVKNHKSYTYGQLLWF
jgi:hypothetical protein